MKLETKLGSVIWTISKLYLVEVIADSPETDMGLEAVNLTPDDGLNKISPETEPFKNSKNATHKILQNLQHVIKRGQL